MAPFGTSSWAESYVLGSHDAATPVFKEPCMLGIDEAGRGPVLGPMVYGICYSPVSRLPDIKSIGFDDSKKLTEEERDGLFDKVKDNSDFVGYTVKVLMPQDISRWMLGRVNYNLNAMSHDTAIALVADALNRGVNVQEVYVDTVGDPKKYQEKLQQRFPAIGKIVVAKKADSLYPVVSAASICAKVTRDDVLRRWAFAEKMAAEPSRAFGSGYPSDPATVAWLAENIDRVFGFPRLIRFSWSTCTTLLQKKGVDVEWFEQQQQDQAEADPQVQSITSFFKKDGATDAEEGAVSASSEPKSFTCLQRLKRLQRF